MKHGSDVRCKPIPADRSAPGPSAVALTRAGFAVASGDAVDDGAGIAPGADHPLAAALAPLARVLAKTFDLPSVTIVARAQNGQRIEVADGVRTEGAWPDLAAALAPAMRRHGDRVLVASDLAIAPMLSAIRLRLGGQPARFLAAAPVPGPGDGRGVVCVCDVRPRRLTALQKALLGDIVVSVGRALDLHDDAEALRQTAALSPHMIWTANADGRIIDVAERLQVLLGVLPPGTLCDKVATFVHPDDAEAVRQRWTQSLGSGVALDVEFRIRVEDGSYRWFHAYAVAMRDGSDAVTGWRGYVEDVHARRLDQIRVSRFAYYDVLTGLGNHAHFRLMLEQHLAAVGRGRHFALLRLELYDFRAMSDTLGHEVGDGLLAQVAIRIGACIRQTDLLAHEGGDAFFVILGDVALPEEATRLADRILRTLSSPIQMDASALSVSAAIGLTMCPADGTSADTLLQNVDLALLRAKRAGRGRCCLFSTETDERLRLRQALMVDMSDALDRRQFSLVYQPVIDIKSGRARAFEALLRWNHPTRGLVSPLEFITEAERNGLIVPIGQWVLEQACRDAMSMPDDMLIAVNLSSVQVRHPGLVQAVADALSRSGLPARRLILEITESVPLLDDADNVEVLNALRGLGVQIALDDFGTGYASLSYLQCFAFDLIKIERSFVTRMLEGHESRIIVRAVIRLSQALGIACVAEGVETKAQYEFLRDEGCDALQGFYFSRPVMQPMIAATLARLQDRRQSENWAPEHRELA